MSDSDAAPATSHSKNTPPPSNVKPVTDTLIMPQLKDLEALAAEVEANLAEEEPDNQPLTSENVQAAWNRYIEQIERETVKFILKQTDIAVKGNEINATVGTVLSENTIRQEKGLMNHLRNTLKNKEIVLTVTVDKSKAPQPVVKKKEFLSPKQIYLKMGKSNPNLHELRKRLDLRPD